MKHYSHIIAAVRLAPPIYIMLAVIMTCIVIVGLDLKPTNFNLVSFLHHFLTKSPKRLINHKSSSCRDFCINHISMIWIGLELFNFFENCLSQRLIQISLIPKNHNCWIFNRGIHPNLLNPFGYIFTRGLLRLIEDAYETLRTSLIELISIIKIYYLK